MSYPIKAVVFDWAGTMVDFGCMAPVEALIDTFAARGVAVSAAQARRDMGRAKRDHVTAILAYPEVAAAWRAISRAHDRSFLSAGRVMRSRMIASSTMANPASKPMPT